MAKTYNWRITFKKGITYLLFYGVPGLIATFLDIYPEYSALTVGTLLVMFFNWRKNREK